MKQQITENEEHFFWGKCPGVSSGPKLGPRINGLVTERNTKLCCQGFVLALFQSTAAYKIDSEHIQDYTKLFPVCKVEISQVTVKK